MPQTTFHTTYSNSQHLFFRTKNGSESGLWSAVSYSFGFNGKENDNEVKGTGNQQDYGMRIYDPRMGRFLSVDPLTKDFPMLTPYQYASNSPIVFIDIDGMEGIHYLEKTKMQDGTTVTKRVVEIDVYVAVSNRFFSLHYKLKDVATVRANLESEFNKGFVDSDCNEVEFRFNMKYFDVEEVSPKRQSQILRGDINNHIVNGDGVSIAQKGCVLTRSVLSANTRGQSTGNLIEVNIGDPNPSHIQAHEMTHTFLNYKPHLNPSTPEEHQEAGGILKYQEQILPNIDVITQEEGVNQDNIDRILESVPEMEDRVIDNSCEE